MADFSMTGTAPNRTLSVFFPDSDPATIPESHEQFQKIVDLLLSHASDDEIRDHVNIVLGAARKMHMLSERITYRNRKLYFDDDPIHGSIVDAILELFAQDSEHLGSVVNFYEKVKTNPSVDAVDGLWEWLNHRQFHLDPDGDFYAYKYTDGHGDQRRSGYSGRAFVNGEEVVGRIPNPDGAVITMPRSEVDPNGNVHCSVGLHAATHTYATRSWGVTGDLILVKINPRDVISVPTDYSFQKLRVCRYVVMGKVEGRLDDKVYFQPTLAEPEAEEEEEIETPKLEELASRESPFEDVESEESEDESPEEDTTISEIEDLLKPVYEYGSVEHYEAKEEGEEFEVAPEEEIKPKFGDLRQQPVLPAHQLEGGSLEIVGGEAAQEVAKAPEKPQEPLRQPNGRFTKAGALYEAKAAQRDALGRFKKNG